MTKAEIKLMLALIAGQLSPLELSDAGFAVLGLKPEPKPSYQETLDAAMDKLAEAIDAGSHPTDPAQATAVRSE